MVGKVFLSGSPLPWPCHVRLKDLAVPQDPFPAGAARCPGRARRSSVLRRQGHAGTCLVGGKVCLLKAQPESTPKRFSQPAELGVWKRSTARAAVK